MLINLVFVLPNVKAMSSWKMQDLGQCRVQLHTETYLGGMSHFLNRTSNGLEWWKWLGLASSIRSLTILAVDEPCCVTLFRKTNFKSKRVRLPADAGKLVEYKKIEQEVGFKPSSIRIHHKSCSKLRSNRRRKGNRKQRGHRQQKVRNGRRRKGNRKRRGPRKRKGNRRT